MTKLVRITMTEGAFDTLARIVENHPHVVAERPPVDAIRAAFFAREEIEMDSKSPADALGPMRPLSDLPGFADLPVDSESREEFGEDASDG